MLQLSVPDILLLPLIALPGVAFVYFYRYFSIEPRRLVDARQNEYLVVSTLLGILLYLTVVGYRYFTTGEFLVYPFDGVRRELYVSLYTGALVISVLLGAAIGWGERRYAESHTGMKRYRGSILPRIPSLTDGKPRVRIGLGDGQFVRGLWDETDDDGLMLKYPWRMHPVAGEDTQGGRDRLGNYLYVPFASIEFLALASNLLDDELTRSGPPTTYKSRLPCATPADPDYCSPMSFVVTNDREFTLAYVAVVVDFLAADGRLVTRSEAHTDNLRPGQSWAFTADVPDSAIVDHDVDIRYNEF